MSDTKSLVLAVEDELTRHVGQKMADATGWSVKRYFIGKGKSGLEKNLENYLNMGRRERVLLIVDMDRPSYRDLCPPMLIQKWLKNRLMPEKMFFRVAVCEVEAWLLADHDAMRLFLGGQPRLPADPDVLEDPKAELLKLLKRVNRYVKEDVVRISEGRIRQGVAYNDILGKWVDENWSPERAAQKSDSLRRAFLRLKG
ncbi:MAG: DUF4276 family protein [Synergistaceae bacterium]|jgi:hypothetical protein|nr:DUF4276 family protein [Synergistaceae bacterium]